MTVDIASLQLRVDSTSVRGARRDLDDLGRQGVDTGRQINNLEREARNAGVGMQFLGGVAKGVVTAFGAIALADLGRSLINTNAQMEQLRSTLTGVTGSIEAGKRSFEFIKSFADDTPYSIEALTQNFIQLKSFGIEPTQKVMESLTNQASKLGGSQETLNSLVTQLGQAYAKQKLQMEDIVVLTERGVPIFDLLAEVTGKEGAALQDMISKGEITRDVIDKLIVKAGELASGSNARAMDTLRGRISNLSDAWHTFEDTLLNDKSEGIIKGIVAGATSALNALSRTLDNSIEAQIATAQTRIKNLKSLNETVGFGLANNSLATEERKLKNLQINQKFLEPDPVAVKPKPKEEAADRARLDDIFNRNRKEFEKGLANVEDAKRLGIIDADRAKKELDKLATAYNKSFIEPTTNSTVSHYSKVQKAIDPVLSQYKSLVESMERQIALSEDSSKLAETLYDTQFGALRKLDSGLKANLISHAKELDLIKEKKDAYAEMEEIIELGNKAAKRQREEEAADRARLDDLFNRNSNEFEKGLANVQDAKNLGIIDADRAKKEFDKLAIAYNKSFIEPASDLTETLSSYAESAAKNIQSAFADYLFDPFNSGAEGMLTTFRKILAQMASEIILSQVSKAAKGFDWAGLASSIVGVFGGAAAGAIGNSLGSAASSVGDFTEQAVGSALKNVNLGSSLNFTPAFADGGDFFGGLRLVGERGPELEVTGPSRIFNADQTKEILRGSKQALPNNNIVINVSSPNGTLDARSMAQLQANLAKTLNSSYSRNS